MKEVEGSSDTKNVLESLAATHNDESLEGHELETSTISTKNQSTSKPEFEKPQNSQESVETIINTNINRYNADVIIDSRSLKKNGLETMDNDCKYKTVISRTFLYFLLLL